MALGGGAVWWFQRPPAPPVTTADPAPETPIPTTSVEPAVPPLEAPALKEATTEEYGAVVKPAVLPKVKTKKVFPEDPSSGTPASKAPIPPMQRGDLIGRGLPNVQPPEPIKIPPYPYPVAAKGSGEKVQVRLAVLVDENGKVIDAVVKESNEPGLGFNEVAAQAARNVPYQPPTRDDIPGKMWTELILEFSEN